MSKSASHILRMRWVHLSDEDLLPRSRNHDVNGCDVVVLAVAALKVDPVSYMEQILHSRRADLDILWK